MNKKAIIYVFSGTGNTMRIAKLYEERFAARGIDTDIYSVTCGLDDMPSPVGYDFVGIGYPVHAFNAPAPVLELARAFPTTWGGRYFIIKTSGEPLKLNDASSCKLNSILSKKGWTLTNDYRYAMPYNIIFRHSGETVDKMWRAAKSMVPADADDIVNGVTRLPQKAAPGKVVSAVFRVEHGFAAVHGRAFKADKDKCVRCGLCAKTCPMHNISLTEKGVKFSGNCALCGRCWFTCPKDAISIGMLNGWKVNGAYSFENADTSDRETHKKYCAEAYREYFAAAEKNALQ